ncbi:MAG TPA: M24 family metallopeptidase [Acidimicrobiales bacterium]|nr:M24 family metallopeptidase [Acidimicrobiales bacterium]
MADHFPAAAVEGVGADYSLEAMLQMRVLTWQALHAIAGQVEVGMSETAAKAMARRTLAERGMGRGWHPVIVRLGPNTARADFLERSETEIVLQPEDVYFVDIGPIYGAVEGDAGMTFAVGEDPEHRRICEDVRAVWNEVRDIWHGQHLSGSALYRHAEQASAARGWKLNPDLAGHRLSDFPHKAHYRGTMAAVDVVPSPDLWVLEIAIVDPRGRFGAFYEDMLLEDQTLAVRGL